MIHKNAHPTFITPFIRLKKLFFYIVPLFSIIVSCFDLPTDPRNKSNSTITLKLKSAKDRDFGHDTYDSLGKNVQIRMYLKYPEFIKSIELKVVDTLAKSDLYTTTVTPESKLQFDTLSMNYTLQKIGHLLFIATASIGDGLKADTAACTVLGSQNHVPKISIKEENRTATAGDLCTLTVKITDNDIGQIHTVTITQDAKKITPQDSQYIWRVPAAAGNEQKLLFTVTDNGNPSLTDTTTVTLAVRYQIPDPPANLHVSSYTNGLTIEWEGSYRALHYAVYKSENDAEFTKCADSLTGISFTDETFSPNNRYYVVASNSAGNSVPSNTVSSSDEVNTAPKWSSDTLYITLKPDSSFSMELTGYSSDQEKDALTYSIGSDAPAGDTIIGTTYSYTVPSSASGTFTVPLIVKDSKGLSDILYIALTVIPDSSSDTTTIDTTPPSIVLINPEKSGQQLSANHVTVRIRCTDINGIASVTCTRAGETVEVPVVAESIYSTEITGLVPGKTETITLIAKDKSANGNSETLKVDLFYSTNIGSITLLSPLDEATRVTWQPTFTWTGGEDADGDSVFFKVLFGKSENKLSQEISGTIERTATLSSSAALEPYTLYYWQVIAYSNVNNDSSRSAVRSFTTEGIAPKITKSVGLKNQTLSAGKTLVLGIEASGTPAPKYQWYHNDLKTDAVTETYSKSNITVDDGGTYYVVVKNEIDTVESERVTVTVLVPPAIDRNPEPKEVKLGDPVTFTVVASGSAPSYQWLVNGDTIDGATGSSYTISATTIKDDQKEFRCVVKNGVDQKTSTAAKLTLLYTVQYNKNGGSGTPPASTMLKKGAKVTLPDQGTLSGGSSAFIGWSTDKDASTGMSPGDSYEITGNGDVTFYAIWKLITLTVSFNTNGGSSVADQIVTYGSKLQMPAVPTKTGNFTFSGWYTSAQLNTEFDQNTSITSSITLHAKWTPYYTVSYDANGVTGTVPTDATHYLSGDLVTVKDKPSNLLKNGYTFSGWNTNSSGTGENRNPGSTYTIGSANVVFFAKWERTTYTITYVCNGGSDPSNPGDYNVETPDFLLKESEKRSYLFDGWYGSQDFKGSKVTGITKGSTGNRTLYAKWVIRDYDGNTYTDVLIGNQVWMVENLKTTSLRTGEKLVHAKTDSEWENVYYKAAYCYYNNDESNKEPFGALYNFYAVQNSSLPPIGWRVPTAADWDKLTEYLTDNYANRNKAIAATSGWWCGEGCTEGWTGYQQATKNNATGFTAYPGSWRDHTGWFVTYVNEGIEVGFWWSSTVNPNSSEEAIYFALNCGDIFLDVDDPKLLKTGMSVRLLRDW